ncbi:hypothetical protein Goari_016159, partial [Gossypium aridum]|nr:hypothetical protein [Gossypium aridum]
MNRKGPTVLELGVRLILTRRKCIQRLANGVSRARLNERGRFVSISRAHSPQPPVRPLRPNAKFSPLMELHKVPKLIFLEGGYCNTTKERSLIFEFIGGIVIPVEVAATARLQWSKPIPPQPPSSSQALVSATSSPSVLCLKSVRRSALFGAHSTTLQRFRCREFLYP